MADLILDWGLFGSNGSDLSDGGTVDTGGIDVTLGFTAQDGGAFARYLEFDQYVDTASGESFDPISALKLFGNGGEGGVDNTSTTTIDFSASDDTFSDSVQDVSFRINDLDLGQGGADYTDIVTVRAFDTAGNPVDVTLTPGAEILTTGDTATGNDVDSPFVTAPTDPDTSLLVDIDGPVSRIEIDYDNGGADSQTVWVTDVHFSTIDADDGLIANDDEITTDEDGGASVIVTDNDVDATGDDVEVASVDTTGVTGTVTLGADGDTLTYDPDGQFEALQDGETATQTFTYTATDGNGNTDTATVTVTINGVNDAPDAVDDSETTAAGASVDIPVLANDTDPESDTLSISDNTAPASGSVTPNGAGGFTYTPNAGFSGTDQFDYTISDGNGGTDTATVTITVGPVLNTPPVAEDDAVETDPDTDVTIPVLGNDSDVEDGVPTVQGAADGANGTTSVNADGTITYSPNAGFTGTDEFEYTVVDSDGATDTATVSIVVGSGPDGVVSNGDEGAFIATNPDSDPGFVYTGDPEGDLVDSGDAILPGEAPEDDIIEAGGGNDTIEAGLGDDDVDAGTGDDIAFGEEGDDEIDGGEGDDTLDGGADNDTLTGGDGSDSVVGGDGNDLIDTGNADPLNDYETFSNDPVPGNPFAFETGADQLNDLDTVEGGAGDDTISTGDDADLIDGGEGNDSIDGGIDDDTILGGTGDDFINGSLGSDSIEGGDGDDTIEAGIDAFSDYEGDDPILPAPGLVDPATGLPALSDPNPDDGRDFVDGGAGNDLINTGDDDDTILGGSGDDTVNAGIDDDLIEGNGGNDSLTGSHGSDTVEGGAGNDTIWGGFGNDPIAGIDGEIPDATDPVPENGRDLLLGGAGNDVIFGEDDDDTIEGGSGDDTIDGGVDDDLLLGQGGADSILGGEGDDTIVGAAENDTIEGGEGEDSITGDRGDDEIDAGAGDDFVNGGLDNDTVIGGLGNDVLRGGQGDDTIIGGSAGDPGIPDATDPDPMDDMDTVFGGIGNDSIFTGDDDDDITAGQGNDTVDAGIDDDSVRGNAGDDSLIGGEGNDSLFGDRGEDTLEGGAGDDVLNGGADGDLVDGGAGNDTVLGGGTGADTLLGGDDRDTFLDAGAGDVVDGGTGGDDFDTLDLTGRGPLRVVDETEDADGDSTSGTVEFLNGDGTVSGSLSFTEIEDVIPCFTPGTVIATPKGERLVEELREGDRVITRDNGLQEIRWVGRRDLTGQELCQAPNLKPVLIRAGSLGRGLPERDMMVSPQHRMLINNDRSALYFEEREVLAAAKHLTGMEGVDMVEASGVSYIHFMFDHHEVVLSNGAWTESFQPGEQVMDGMGEAQRNEIYDLFPDLRAAEGLKDYQAARRSLKKHEAKLLMS